MCASVIAGVDAPPILELSEHVLDFMAVPVEATVIWNLDFAVGFRGNTGLNSTVSKGGAEPICVISLVAQKLPSFWNCGQHQCRPFEIARLPFAQEHDQRPSKPVTNCV